MRVALYFRRSTNEELQPDSHDIQEEQLREHARAEGHVVVRTYPDDGSGVNADRTGFQQLIKDVTTGPEFDAILVLDVTRWGRFANVDESAYWDFFCHLHGVQVLYVNEPFRNDGGPYDALLKTLKRMQAAEFSKDKSRTVQYAKARVVRNGFYPGGSAPYGMTRFMVRPDGVVIQELGPGEHKAIGNYRIKLAPGDPAEVAAVTTIYALFLGGMNRKAIARHLDHEGIRPPVRGTNHWYYGEVHKILRNPIYAGIAKIRCTPSPNFPTGETIHTPGAWPAIIHLDTWRAVQDRLDRSLWERTPPGLAEQLKRAFERSGALNRKAIDVPTWETYLRHFKNGTQEALALAYAPRIQQAERRILDTLRETFTITKEDGIYILNGLLRVRITPSFPRLLRRGVYWEYRFHPDDPQDVTIGLAFSPPPVVCVLQTFLFHNNRYRPRQRTIHPNLYGRTNYHQTYGRTLPQIVTALHRHQYRDARHAKEQLLAALREYDRVSTREVARRLGWPYHTTYALYRSLARDGHHLPPLKQGRKGFVTVTCGACKQDRTMGLWHALKLKTDLCGQCWQTTRCSSWTDVTCPSCGKVRRYSAKELRRLAHGTSTHCVHCTTPARVKAYETRRVNSRRRRATMHLLATCVRELLEQRYADVRLTSHPGSVIPRLSWQQPPHRKRQKLRITCTQKNALQLTNRTLTELQRLAHDLVNRRRWRKSNDQREDIWNVRLVADAML